MANKNRKRYPHRNRNRISPLWFVIGAALLVVVAFFAWPVLNATSLETSPGKTGPRLAVNQERIDFGRVPLGKTVRAEFQVTNTGDRTLTLDASSPIRALEGC